MMLFDIIDETAHVQYAHRWPPDLARLAGVDNSDYRARANRVREEKQKGFNRMGIEFPEGSPPNGGIWTVGTLPEIAPPHSGTHAVQAGI